MEDFEPIYITREQVLKAFEKIEPYFDASEEENMPENFAAVKQELAEEREKSLLLQKELRAAIDSTKELKNKLQETLEAQSYWKEKFHQISDECTNLQTRLDSVHEFYAEKVGSLSRELLEKQEQLNLFQGNHQNLKSLNFNQTTKLESQLIESLQSLQSYKSELLENMKVSDALLCVVCWTHEISVMVRPCNHVNLCEVCIDKIDECPICRTSISFYEKVYISK